MSQDYSAFKAATRPGKVDPSVDTGYAPYVGPPRNYPTIGTSDMPPPLAPKIPAATARRLQALPEIPPMVPAKTYARLKDAELEGYTSRPKPMLPAKTMARYLGLLDPPTVVEEPQGTPAPEEKPELGFGAKTVEGLKGALPQLGITVLDVIGIPLKASVMLENTFLPKSDYQENGLKILTGAQDKLREYMPQIEEGLTFGQQLRDPRIVIPGVVDFGTQILMMGGLGAFGKTVGQKMLLSPKAQEAVALGISSFYAGHIEGTHTYFEALKRGKTNGQALAAYAMQTVGSGVVSIPEAAFLFSKLPGPFQQGLVRRLAAGTVNGLTEAVDEVISDMALSGEVDAARALAVYKDAYARIGTAAMLVGLLTGGAGAPPELVHRAPTPGEVGADVDLTQVSEQDAERAKYARERMASVLNMEADFFDTVDGQRISTVGGGVKGGVVEGDSDSYWVSGIYNAKDGVSIPVSRIAQVGRYDDQGNEVILATSEGQQQVYAKMEEMEKTVFSGPSQFQARSMTHDEIVAERYERTKRLQTNALDRSIEGEEAPKLGDIRRERPRPGEGIEGLESAVKSGISSGPERQAVEVPVETSDKMFAQLDKLSAAEERKKKPESANEAQQNKKRDAGLRGSVTAIQNQVKANIEPIGEEGTAADLEQMVARAAEGKRVSTIDEVLAAEEEVRRMDRRLKAQTSTVVDEKGNLYPIRPQLMTHVAKGSSAPARAFSGENMVDVQAEVLRMVGSEDAMSALRRGDISAEDVMMRATESAGLLRFETVEGQSVLKAVRVEGQNSLDYQAAISLYVTNARRLKNLIYYMRETEALREQGINARNELETALADKEKETKAAKEKADKAKKKRESLTIPENPETADVAAPSATVGGRRAMFQTKKSRREALNRKTVDETARYMAAIRHSGLYHEILRAGQTAKWNNPFEVAETVSEFTFARATAWAAQKRGRTQQQFYDEFIREVRAYGREMTESQYDVFRATQGFAVPKEMLFQSDDRTAAQKVADFFRRRKPEPELSAGDLRRAHDIVYDRMHLVEILRGLEPSLQSEGQQIARDLEAKFREFAARPIESLRLEEIEAAVQEARAKTFELEGKVLFSKGGEAEMDDEAEARAKDPFYDFPSNVRYRATKARMAKMTNEQLGERVRTHNNLYYRANEQLRLLVKKEEEARANMSFEELLRLEFTPRTEYNKKYDRLGILAERARTLRDQYSRELYERFKAVGNAETKISGGSIASTHTDTAAIAAAFNLNRKEATALMALTESMGMDLRQLYVGRLQAPAFRGMFVYTAAHNTRAEFLKGNIQGIISGAESADFAVALHELAHYTKNFAYFAYANKVGSLTREDLIAAQTWAGIAGNKLRPEWPDVADERFAEGFVAYIRENAAPTPALRRMFRAMSTWITDIFSIGKGNYFYHHRLNPDIRRVFRKLVTANKSFNPPNMFSKKDRQILGSYDPRTHSVEFFLGSDMHTVIHEFGHAFRQSLSENENKALEKFIYAGRKRPKDGQWDVKAEEKFADAFLVWAGSANLDAVPIELRETFSHIGYYLTNLYATGRALKPGTKVNPDLARVMERLITKQLVTSADGDDREEGKRRERIRREFLRSKPLVNLGDHVEAIAEVLGIDKSEVSKSPMLREEMAKRTSNKSYMAELAHKLKRMESDNLVSIDIVDFMIVRDRAIEIRSQFELEFRDAYNKGDEAVVALAEKWHKRKAHNDLKHYMTVAGDAGRRLNLLTNKAIGIDFALVLDETQKKYGAKGFDILHSMLKDPQNAYAIANKKAAEDAPGIFDLYMQAFYGGMLSSPKTLAINTVFTGLWTGFQHFVHLPIRVATERTMWTMRDMPAIGKLVDKFWFQGDTRSRDEVAMSVGLMYSQLRDSVPLGFKEATAIMRDPSFGLNPFDTLKGMDIVAKDIDSWQRYTLLRNTRLNRALSAVLGKSKGEATREKITDTIRRLGPVVSIATNSMRASDMFFKVIAAEGAINRLLQAEAAKVHPNNVKLQREYVFEQTKKYARNMHSMPAAWQEEIIKAASYNTFMDLPGAASRHIIAARESVPVIKLVLPFFNTLVNIGKRGLEMTPGIGLAAEAAWLTDKSFTKGQYGHTKADIIAKQIEGSVMAALIFMLLGDDELTGEMPEDPKERAFFLQSGKLPYSIKLGDRWVSYEFADPFAIPLKIVANLRQYVGRAIANMGDPSPEVQKKVTQDLTTAGWAIGSLALNNPFMRTYHDYVEAETGKSRLKALGRTAESSVVPFSGLLRWMQRKANMMQNEEGYFVTTEEGTIVDSSLPLTHNVINGMFGLPTTDIPRLTVWGEPYTYSDNKWWELWWPVNYSEAKADSVDEELERLGAGVGMPSRFYEHRGVKYMFSPEIYQQLVLGFGEESKPRIRELIENPRYAEWGDTRKLQAISRITDRARDRHRRLARLAQRKAGEIPT